MNSFTPLFLSIFVLIIVLPVSCAVDTYVAGRKSIKTDSGEVRRNLTLSDAKLAYFKLLNDSRGISIANDEVEKFIREMQIQGFVVPPICGMDDIWAPTAFKYLINNEPNIETILSSKIYNSRNQLVSTLKRTIKLNKGRYELIIMDDVNRSLLGEEENVKWQIETQNITTGTKQTYSFDVKLILYRT